MFREYPLNLYTCLSCHAMYQAYFVERKGKTICTWDGAALVPYETSLAERALKSKESC